MLKRIIRRLKRFVTAFRILGIQSYEKQELAKEINLAGIKTLVDTLITPPLSPAPADRVVLSMEDIPEIAESDQDRILAQAQVQFTYPVMGADKADKLALVAHQKKFSQR